jgi:dTDP-4-amino-4,6-dideoxygalactose transaminase
VPVEPDPAVHNITAAAVEAAITPRTKAIMPVHLYGQPADMDAVMQIAQKHRLWVVEDCAQAHLARFRNRTVGTFGAAATFSFYPSKNLGAMGDAGAIVTNDPALAERMAAIARHGGLRKGEHGIEGVNSRLDGLQAAILSVKLRHLASWTQRRRELAARYTDLLEGVGGFGLPATAPGREHVWHLYVVQHGQRDALARHLQARGVQTVINYPVALPFLPAYARLGHRPADFPNAFAHQSRILSLPLYPEMTGAQMQAVMDGVASFRP